MGYLPLAAEDNAHIAVFLCCNKQFCTE